MLNKKPTIFGIGIVLVIILILVLTVSDDHGTTLKNPHYTEFDGKITVENQCSENKICYGHYDNNTTIILDCSGMVIHGCSDIQDFNIEE